MPFNYVIDGNSRVADDNSITGTNNWFNQLVALLPGVTGKNWARSANEIAYVRANYELTGGPFFTFGPPRSCIPGAHQFSPAITGIPGYYFLFDAYNDVAADPIGPPGSTGVAGDILADYSTLVTRARIDKYAKIFTFTIAPSTFLTVGQEAQRVALNSALVANTIGADVVVDIAAMFPNASDAGIYADGLHFTPLAMTLITRAMIDVLTAQVPIINDVTVIEEAKGLTRQGLNGGISTSQFATWLNRLNRQYCAKMNWPDLIVRNAVLTTVANQATYPLALNFGRFAGKTVTYDPTAISGGYQDGYQIPIMLGTSDRENDILAGWRQTGAGTPAAVALESFATARVFPAPDTTGKTIVYDYVAAPATFTGLGIELDVPSLQGVLTLEMAAEICRWLGGNENRLARQEFLQAARREYNTALGTLLTS